MLSSICAFGGKLFIFSLRRIENQPIVPRNEFQVPRIAGHQAQTSKSGSITALTKREPQAMELLGTTLEA
jgi:hypothetical protein